MITDEGLIKLLILMTDQYEEKVLYLLSHYDVIYLMNLREHVEVLSYWII